MIIFSLQSKFSSRSGSASIKGTKQRLDQLEVIWWQTNPGDWIILGYAKDRMEYENIKRTLNLYAGCKFPMVIESADGSLTCRKYGEDGVVRVNIPEEVKIKIQGRL